MDKLLQETKILDYSHHNIQNLIKDRGWDQLNDVEKVKSIYNFVRDEIEFGYNTNDNISASKVLEDGYGQCNTKSTLLMALLRGVGIKNRLHGFTIDKALQKGAISGIWYQFSPKNILHSWVEVNIDGRWYSLEGVILDKKYLVALQNKFADCKTTFCGFGAYTDNFKNPNIDWNLNDTYIQDKGINQDFGLFATPDEFYKQYQQKLNPFKQWVYRNIVRQQMNKNVRKIRERL
ncbi:transglutaminase-like domain-containing protein [Psychrobacter sp. I-STPA10]|uniref:transglutaminase-like domain-containing protein n=1 Tax=Psychrobacter sp. I-STPA10 TaxID=2585769 RepID=UPI001E4AF7F7|nr:transglutaminase family protein [Psychrobacter sp. I-STPA10]